MRHCFGTRHLVVVGVARMISKSGPGTNVASGSSFLLLHHLDWRVIVTLGSSLLGCKCPRFDAIPVKPDVKLDCSIVI